MKLLVISMAVMLATGCATAEQRMASRADYRDSQIEAIKVQAEAETVRQTNHALGQQQMWQSMAEVVKANPDSASHFAIVMAVAAARGATEASESPQTATLKTEREVLPIDYVKALAPALINTVGTVGTAAILADQTKESIRANRDVRIVEAGVEGKIYDVLGAAVTDGEYVSNDTVDDAADTMIDDVVDDVTDDTVPADDVVDPADDVVDPADEPAEEPSTIDCSQPQFSPTPPECQS